MFSRPIPKYQFQLERQLELTIAQMQKAEIGSDQYSKALSAVTTLHKMVEAEKPPFVSKDTLFIVGGNLLGIILILKHEHLNPITSKALSFVIRTRT